MKAFTPIDEREYPGYNGWLGRNGYDESVLAQYSIIDDPKCAATARADADPDEPECLNEMFEPCEDEPTRATCADREADFDLTDGVETDVQRTVGIGGGG